MIAVKQSLKHDPANGVWGDCHRAALASVLELPIGHVPHFGEGGPDAEVFKARVLNWLETLGLTTCAIPFNGPDLAPVLATMAMTGRDVYWFLGGTSRTGCGHTVVCRGGKIVHDPSPTDAGIIGPMEDGFFWAEIIAALEPERIANPPIACKERD